MGIWGMGLLDNDSAMDELLMLLDNHVWPDSPAARAVEAAVRLELTPDGVFVDPDGYADALGDPSDWAELPPDIQALLADLAEHPLTHAERRRVLPPTLARCLGITSLGTRLDPIYELPEAPAMLADLVEDAAVSLDALDAGSAFLDVYGELGLLALPVVFRDRVWIDPDRVALWRESIDWIDANTDESLEHWTPYLAHVVQALDLIVQAWA